MIFFTIRDSIPCLAACIFRPSGQAQKRSRNFGEPIGRTRSDQILPAIYGCSGLVDLITVDEN